jgi:hypothetical protein
VLNVSAGQSHAIARAKVHVVDYDVKIKSVMSGTIGYVEIANDSGNELNLEGWHLRFEGGRDFIFPVDTIISGNSAIKVPMEMIAENDHVVLLGPNYKQVTDLNLTFAHGANASGDVFGSVAAVSVAPVSFPIPSVDASSTQIIKAKERLATYLADWRKSHRSILQSDSVALNQIIPASSTASTSSDFYKNMLAATSPVGSGFFGFWKKIFGFSK